MGTTHHQSSFVTRDVRSTSLGPELSTSDLNLIAFLHSFISLLSTVAYCRRQTNCQTLPRDAAADARRHVPFWGLSLFLAP